MAQKDYSHAQHVYIHPRQKHDPVLQALVDLAVKMGDRLDGLQRSPQTCAIW